jgi:CheY-like chemotaxis protein
MSDEQNNKKYKLLLAEDEEDARMIYIDILEGGGFEIDGAEDGKTTLELLEENTYDLLLLDIIMPDLDGISVLSEIKKYPAKYGEPIIIMLTNIGGDVAIEKALRIGAKGYMLKSETEPKELIEKVNEYLEEDSNS